MITTDEWDRFFAKLADRCNITEACAASGVARSTIYAYEAGDFPQEFDDDARATWRARFEDARRQAADKLEAEAFRRAIDGTDEPLIGRVGKDQDGIITTVKRYSDGLLTLLLKANRPDKFKDKVATELSGPGGKPIQTETKVIAVPAIEEGAPE